jgi:adenine-specific DNA-methyltransferase
MATIQKFQELLNKLFQFEASDLDFGIYRVLNYKRDKIEKFIKEDLKNKVETAFAKHKDERLTDINWRFEEAKEKVFQSLGRDAFTPTGELKEEFKDTPLGRDFLSLKAQKDEAQAIDEIKLQVFNDLYNFFSRYYEEGDFAPHYRYSIKGHKYAIPYNGEEVKLYWANSEQYYTKTGLLFRDYTFKADDYKVIFRVVSAREELASNKVTKERFFVLDDEKPLTVEDKALVIRFQYRELTEKEVKHYEVEGGSNTAKQEKINLKRYDEVLKKANDATLKAILGKEYKNGKPLLLYHISRFTAKNTKDYFIHKNLKKFLSDQLDYFIKADVLDIETLEKERFLDKHITRAKVVHEIGEDIIDFLSQIEDFQKKLWEKKKFVLKTEYVITTDHVPEEFYDEIWENKEQREEWEELGFEIPSLASLRGNATTDTISRKKYLFILGEKQGKSIAVVWRKYEDNWNEDDFKEDKEFIVTELEPWAPHIVYVNGQSVLTPNLGKHILEIRSIEPEFKRLMGR